MIWKINKLKSPLVIFFLLLMPVLIGAVPKPTEQFYINDYANVLSQEIQDSIYNTSKELYEKTGAQIVVLTINSLEGKDIKDYSLETARTWGIGTANKDNGILILLSTIDRKARIEVGYGLEGYLNDSKVGRLLDEYAIPYYKDDNFEKGTEQLYYAVLNVVRQEYGLKALPDTPVYTEQKMDIETFIGIVLMFAFVAFFIWLMLAGAYFCWFLLLLIIDLFTNGNRAKNFSKNLIDVILFWRLLKRVRIYRKNHTNWDDDSDSGGGGSFGGGGSDRSF